MSANEQAVKLIEEAKVFITAWNSSGSVAEVCVKLAKKEAAVQNQAAVLRKMGIPLKKMQRGKIYTQEAVDQLKSFSAQLLGQADSLAEEMAPAEESPAPRKTRKGRQADSSQPDLPSV